MINRNGEPLLAHALKTCRVALEQAWADSPCFEFLVVDNGSTDSSIQTIERHLAGAVFPWRVVTESVAGVNFARNAGIHAAKGELLIYTDSDLKFDARWLQAYLEVEQSYPDCEIFAGQVAVGDIEGEVPAWLDISGPYKRSAIVVQMQAGELTQVIPLVNDQGLGPVGPNMAFRRSIIDRYGEFDTNFGLRPGSLVPGAEAEYFDRLARYGLSFLYVPCALVHHPIRNYQLNTAYFLKRLQGIGQVNARINLLRGEKSRRMFGLSLYVFRQLVGDCASYASTILTTDIKKRFHILGQMAIRVGYLREEFEHYRRNGNRRQVQATAPEGYGISRI